MRFGLISMSLRIVQLAVSEKHECQAGMDIEECVVEVEIRCDPARGLVMVDRLLLLAFGSIYITEDGMRFADIEFFAFLWEHFERASGSFFRRVELIA